VDSAAVPLCDSIEAFKKYIFGTLGVIFFLQSTCTA